MSASPPAAPLTTMLLRRDQMRHKALPNCHNGQGDLDFTEVLKPDPARRIHFIHDDILAPGVSIGVHQHADDEEYYYIVSGSGLMTLDDQTFPVSAGDITGVYPGGRHGLLNNTDTDLRIVVISIKR